MQSVITTISTQNTGFAMLSDIITALKNTISQNPVITISTFTTSTTSSSTLKFTIPGCNHIIEFQGYYDNYKYKIGFYVRSITNPNTAVTTQSNEPLNPNATLIRMYYDNNAIILILDCASLVFCAFKDINNQFWTKVGDATSGISGFVNPLDDIGCQIPYMEIYQFTNNNYPLFPIFPIYNKYAYPYQFANLFQTAYLSSASLFTLYSIPQIMVIFKFSSSPNTYSLVVKFQ